MANSIKTNFAAQTALQSLNSTNKALEKTQNRISTGYRVGEASDNAAYWAIATSLRTDNGALSTVRDALGLGASQLDVAYTGVTAAKAELDEIGKKIMSAMNGNVDKTLVQAEISQRQESLLSIATSASLGGQNWLVGSTGTDASATIVSSFARGTDGSAVVGTIAIDLSEVRLFADSAGSGGALGTVFSIDITGFTEGQLVSAYADVTSASNALTEAATNLGSLKSRVSVATDFNKSLMDAVERSVSTLVDADMNEESTRLQSLQVQQQLGVQALSIANQSSQSILSLFR